jgi:hypothetical protein
MSVIDDLQGLENRVRERMRELRPMLAEYRDLEAVARRLGIDVDQDAGDEPASGTTEPQPQAGRPRSSRRGAGRPSSSAATARSRSRTGRRGGRARSGSRREQLLALVKDQPGITVREAGQRLGVDGTSLYRVVHRLEQEGAVKKEGTKLQPA